MSSAYAQEKPAPRRFKESIMKKLFVLLAFFGLIGSSFAQESPKPADAPGAAPITAAPAADAASPVAQKLDTGNTAWMLTSTALVLFMTIPGLALFYGGMVRKKNVLGTLMQSFAI